MKKGIMFAAAAMTMCMLCGCNASGRVHDKAYLRAAALDDEGSITLAFFSDDEALTVRGGDIPEALGNAEVKLGKRIFTGYTELVILSSSQGCEELKYLLRDWRVPPSCLTVCSSGSGERILKSNDPQALADGVRLAAKRDDAPPSDIITVLENMLADDFSETASLSVSGDVSTGVIGNG